MRQLKNVQKYLGFDETYKLDKPDEISEIKETGETSESNEKEELKKTFNTLQMCVNNEEAICFTPCEWSTEKKICTVPVIKCTDIKEEKSCSGTCIWNDSEKVVKKKATQKR